MITLSGFWSQTFYLEFIAKLAIDRMVNRYKGNTFSGSFFSCMLSNYLLVGFADKMFYAAAASWA